MICLGECCMCRPCWSDVLGMKQNSNTLSIQVSNLWKYGESWNNHKKVWKFDKRVPSFYETTRVVLILFFFFMFSGLSWALQSLNLRDATVSSANKQMPICRWLSFKVVQLCGMWLPCLARRLIDSHNTILDGTWCFERDRSLVFLVTCGSFCTNPASWNVEVGHSHVGKWEGQALGGLHL